MLNPKRTSVILGLGPMAELSIPVSVLRAHDTKDFIVYSPALDLSSCGRTEKHALKMFAEAARLFLEEPPELLRQKRVHLNLTRA